MCILVQLFDVAIEGGAEDVLPISSGFKVVCDTTSFGDVRNALVAGGFEVDEEESGLSMAPNATIPVRKCTRK